jgi:hypothetical protein
MYKYDEIKTEKMSEDEKLNGLTNKKNKLLSEMHLIKLQELKLTTVKQLRTLASEIEQMMDIQFGQEYGLYNHDTTGKVPVISITEDAVEVNFQKQNVKDMNTLFEEMGCIVYRNPDDRRILLSSGNYKEFPAIIEKNGYKIHIEIISDAPDENEFLEEMDKTYQVTNDFFFVVPNEEQIHEKIKVCFSKWIHTRFGGMENVKGKMRVNFATFDKIKKKEERIWKSFLF